ncbi:glutamine--fructose-6-phosphate transaminase (isomerizing) [Methanococcus voltae]|uniref:Glutamine--fructose-6-phosphate aminotransferase [isomerizing] n=1 Tax=Methanococcus voltae (strain ATCC BAA-1334 / A3) TaxID=456320 RepID=D7DUX8_METV3|nr:glutamine--fructose-6-phosphate transaminase (isomerizing) [Methanococcus voltae]MCS3900742.1 glucosamine--fructose-6-phosphate aminotransferase (isomerizing) [Methanococcus voltae]
MCGIIGYIGSGNASEILLDGLKRLEYRGYDSCGIGIITSNDILVKKNIGKVKEVSEYENFEEFPSNIGLGHSRWATHGGITKENSHPHTDCNNEICIVHNGIISNYKELKNKLVSKGHVFKSETDTEVIPHLIEEEIKELKNKNKNNNENNNNKYSKEDYINCIKKAFKKIEGTYAVVIINKNFPNTLIGIRNESPMVVGLGKDDSEYFIGSDVSAFLKYTNKALPLEDGDLIIIDKNDNKINNEKSNSYKFEVFNLKNNCVKTNISKNILTLDWNIENAEKKGYEHFMLKEIMEEPEIIKNSIKISQEEIQKLAGMINDCDKIYVIAMGTSLHAGMIAEYWFSKLGKLVIPCDSSEFLIKGIIDEKTLVVGITQSGETYDTIKAIKYAKNKGAKTASLVNVIGSTATRESDVTIMIGSGLEISVCATKTFMSQLVILYRLFIEYGKLINKNMEVYEKELEKIPKYISKTIKNKEKIKEISENLTATNYLFISKGINLANAYEGALKFKEITYLHAEGMSSGFLKHGTISLIDKNMDTLALIPPLESPLLSSVLANVEEIKARGGKVIAVGPKNVDLEAVELIEVPNLIEEVSPFVYAPACQLLAYYKALTMGRDVDKPRGLAKSVTVE